MITYKAIEIMIMMISVFMLMAAVHNIDNSWNTKYIEKNYNSNIGENTLFLKDIKADNLYMMGLLMLPLSFAAFAAGLGIYGYKD